MDSNLSSSGFYPGTFLGGRNFPQTLEIPPQDFLARSDGRPIKYLSKKVKPVPNQRVK